MKVLTDNEAEEMKEAIKASTALTATSEGFSILAFRQGKHFSCHQKPPFRGSSVFLLFELDSHLTRESSRDTKAA